MKISIITVCYNAERYIADALTSVRAQSHPDIEHIVVDGCSSDSTLAIVRAYGPERVVSEPDKGLYDAMNKGVAMAAGEVIGILNADDFYRDDHVVARVAALFERHPDVDMIYGNVEFVMPDDTSRMIRFYDARHFRPWKLRYGWMPPHPACFVRRSVFERYGAYRLDYRISADYEFFVRTLLCAQVPSLHDDQTYVLMRDGGISTRSWRNRLALNIEIVRACRANGVFTMLPLVLMKLPFKLLELVRSPRRQA